MYAHRLTIIILGAFALVLQWGACANNPGSSNTNGDTSKVSQSGLERGTDKNNLSKEPLDSVSWLLIPGKQAGKIALNADVRDLYNEFGKPDQQNAATGKAALFWFGIPDASGSVSVFSSMDMGNSTIPEIKLIRVSSSKFKTQEGISVAMDIDRIRNTFPDLKAIETFQAKGSKYTIYDSRKGIAFETNEEGVCSAVFIHEANREVSNLHAKLDFAEK